MANTNSCDFVPEFPGAYVRDATPAEPVEELSDNRSSCYRFLRGTFVWEGAVTESYQSEGGGSSGMVRNVIIGSRGESCPFDLRYFQVEPGGSSRAARHPREHVVIGVRGKGKAVVGDRSVDLNPLDVLYIAPDEFHQIANRDEQPFGFFCIVASERESAAELLQDELDWLQEEAQSGVSVRR